jgi:hypothetical protein
LERDEDKILINKPFVMWHGRRLARLSHTN